MTLEEKIRFIRRHSFMTQTEFGKEVGCSQVMISSYERGTRRPSYEVLVAINQLAKKHKVKVTLL